MTLCVYSTISSVYTTLSAVYTNIDVLTDFSNLLICRIYYFVRIYGLLNYSETFCILWFEIRPLIWLTYLLYRIFIFFVEKFLFYQHTPVIIRRFLKSPLSSDYQQSPQWVLLVFPSPVSGCTTTPMKISHNLLNRDPWFLLVNKSTVVSLFGHHSTDISPCWILWVAKKRMLVRFVILPIDYLPLFFTSSALLLSWKMMFLVTL